MDQTPIPKRPVYRDTTIATAIPVINNIMRFITENFGIPGT